MTTVSVESLGTVSDEWEALADRLAATPFHTAGWARAWWAAFGQGELLVLAARKQGALVGVLPVVRRGATLASPTNWHTATFGSLADAPDVTVALCRELVALGPRRIDLSFLQESEERVLWEALRAGGYDVEARTIQRSPYLPISGEWEPFWSSRSRNLRGTIRRCRNRLADHGEVSITINGGEHDLEAQLAEGFGIEGSGWKEAQGTAIASRAETRRFYEDVACYAAAKGTLRLGFLRIDGRAAAFNYSLESGGRHYLVKLGHDPELNSAGPGTVLTAAMIEHAFRAGLDCYEFLGAADSYKLRWSGLCHERRRLQAFAPTLAGRADRLIQIRGRALAKRLLRRSGAKAGTGGAAPDDGSAANDA